jgi:hypothetical protein
LGRRRAKLFEDAASGASATIERQSRHTPGFLEFRKDSDDCRRRMVTLTKSGRRITKAAA